MNMMKRIIKEPLLHFLLLGIGLFLVHGMMQKTGSAAEPGLIVVTQGEIEHLAASFRKIWQRPPTQAEMAGLVRDRVREEVYYREAVALGLDKGDTVIRRRLLQKLEFISSDIAPQTEPTDVDLNAYLQAHADEFRIEPRFSFNQVYLNPEKHGANLARDAAQVLMLLKHQAGNSELAIQGDALMLESRFSSIPASEVAQRFGRNNFV